MPQRARAAAEAAGECACWGCGSCEPYGAGAKRGAAGGGGRGSGISPEDQWCVAGTGGAELAGSRGIYSGGWRMGGR